LTRCRSHLAHIAHPADVIVTIGDPIVSAAKHATSSIPIVMAE
jgi:hypothetical protein